MNINLKALIASLKWAYLPELAGACAILVLYMMNALRFVFPVGFAGLYALMIEQVVRQPWPPPEHIPLYGPGGIPFAYPPLGAYVGAFFIKVLHTPVFEYLVWAPIAFSLLSAIFLYAFLRYCLEDYDKALLSVLMAGTTGSMYFWHVTAGGVVRALALALSLAGLYAGARAMRDGPFTWALLAGLFLGLSLMTHLSYALFFALGQIALALFLRERSPRHRIFQLLVLLIVATVVSSSWWGLVLHREGIEVFLRAGTTHGTPGPWYRASGRPLLAVLEALKWIPNLGRGWDPPFLPGLTLAGLAYAIATRRWFLPTWIISVSAVVGETVRFEELIGSALSANLLVDLVRLRLRGEATGPGVVWSRGLLLYGVLMGAFLYQGARIIYNSKPSIDAQLIEVAEWFREATGPDETFLIVPYEEQLAEWLPYLTRRRLLVGKWGAEWNGKYQEQAALQEHVKSCAQAQSLGCFESLFARLPISPEYMIVDTNWGHLVDALGGSSSWKMVFSNGRYVVYKRST
jgi:hypothetical protein